MVQKALSRFFSFNLSPFSFHLLSNFRFTEWRVLYFYSCFGRKYNENRASMLD